MQVYKQYLNLPRSSQQRLWAWNKKQAHRLSYHTTCSTTASMTSGGCTVSVPRGFPTKVRAGIHIWRPPQRKRISSHSINTAIRMSAHLSRTAGQWNRRHRHICWARCSAHRSGSHSHTQLPETEEKWIQWEIQTLFNSLFLIEMSRPHSVSCL